MVLIGLATTTALIVLAGVLIGLGFGCLLPMMQAILINQVPATRVGVATSTFYLLLDTGSGLGPVLLGLIVGVTGFSTMFLLSTVLVVAAGAAYALFHGRAARRLPVAGEAE